MAVTVLDQTSRREIAELVVARILEGKRPPSVAEERQPHTQNDEGPPSADLTSAEEKKRPLLEHPADPEALARMTAATPARIGVGKAGPRLKTRTLLTLRADHARARDAVFSHVDPALLERMGLPQIQSLCRDKDEHITRPDLGRRLNAEGVAGLKARAGAGCDVQIIVSDGLSSTAVDANLEKLLTILEDGLRAAGHTLGETFFVRYGRVAVEDEIAELLGAKLVCILIGERPGLGTAESMSAYLCYGARIGQPESRRTVVSNIHRGGIPAAEAGAYLVTLAGRLLEAEASGIELTKEGSA